MKKSSTRATILIILVIVTVVGYYAYLSNKEHKSRAEVAMTFTETVLSRDLEVDYPPTPKEVLKYYNQIQKCLFNEDCTQEQIESLILKQRELFDSELLENNTLAMHMIQYQQEREVNQSKNRKLTSTSVASSANVIYDTVDGFEFAKLNCGYNVMEGNRSIPVTQVFVLRKDTNRRWKIYGWKLLNDFQETSDAE